MLLIQNPEQFDTWIPCPVEESIKVEALDDNAIWLAIPFSEVKRGYIIRAFHSDGEPYRTGLCSLAVADAEPAGVGRGYQIATIQWMTEEEIREKVIQVKIDELADQITEHLNAIRP